MNPFSLLMGPAGVIAAVTVGAIHHLQVDVMNLRFAMCVLVLLSPHILYYYVWNYAGSFQKVFGKKSVTVLSYMAHFLKAMQLATWAQWFTELPGQEYLIVAALLFAVGSLLNVLVYYKIGAVGVYYGFKLGHTIPWVTSFPFNCMRHPQYIGAVLNFASVAVLASTVYWREVLALLLVQVTAYLYTATMESTTDYDAQESVRADQKIK